jgi:hypothetical protein
LLFRFHAHQEGRSIEAERRCYHAHRVRFAWKSLILLLDHERQLESGAGGHVFSFQAVREHQPLQSFPEGHRKRLYHI